MNYSFCSQRDPIHYFTCADPPNELELECGQKLGPITVAYETFGNLNSQQSNAILICHALSGDSHVSSSDVSLGERPGWWNNAVGSGKVFDPSKYFIICSNVLGGCSGTTGPSSINPATAKPYALDFPLISIHDMVNIQKLLIDYLQIETLFCVVGGSMGGMQALDWVVSYPDMVKSAIIIASTSKHSALAIGLNSIGRQAIITDPKWNSGNYYDFENPEKGLAVARMVGHISYVSEFSVERKFGRKTAPEEQNSSKFNASFQIEKYLDYQGSKFVKRFDANSYLYITKALDDFDLEKKLGTLERAFQNYTGKILVLSFSSDWLYPTHQSLKIVSACKENNIDVEFKEINSQFGHDSFLVDTEKMTCEIKKFLLKKMKN